MIGRVGRVVVSGSWGGGSRLQAELSLGSLKRVLHNLFKVIIIDFYLYVY